MEQKESEEEASLI